MLTPETHVYCTECRHGKRLFEFLMSETLNPQEEPEVCQCCCSWNPEDSLPYQERPGFEWESSTLTDDLLKEKRKK